MGKYLDLEGLNYLCRKIKADLAGKQDQMAGQPGQLVGFCENGISALTVAAGDNLSLKQTGSVLEMGVDMDRGSMSGSVSLLDEMTKPGIYTWLDEDGTMGFVNGLWNVFVTEGKHHEGLPQSVVQILFGTCGNGITGRVLTRTYYYANIPNWIPWRELAGMDQIPNPNLLDNWYLANPINQRGQTEYTGAGYTIDRWRMTGSGFIKVQDNGIWIQKAPGAAHITFGVRIEKFRVSGSETVTVSAIVDGTLVSATGKIEAGIQASGFTSNALDRIDVYHLESLPEVHIVRFVIVSEQPFLLQAAKLERGSMQTLARQAADGGWELKDPPPDPTLELLKCQRYYQVFSSQEQRPVKAADFRPAMRINPALGSIMVDGATYYTADANL